MAEKQNSVSRRVPGKGGRLLWMFVSYGIAAGCLYWIFHDVPLTQVLHSIARIDWRWVPPAIGLNLLVYMCAAWEWQFLLRPVGRISFWQAVQALFAGRFANDVLPVHAGYIFRIYLASSWIGTSVASVLPSFFVERFLDGFWLALSIGATMLFIPLPPELVRAGEVLGGIIVTGGAAMIWLAWSHNREHEKMPGYRLFRWKPLRKLRQFFHELIRGLKEIGGSYLLPLALGFSMLKLILQGLAFLLLFKSYGFAFSFWVSVAVFMVCYVGLSVPSTPASVGVFQLFCIAGLRFFGVSKLEASGFALMAFVVLVAPLSVAGFVAFAQSGLTLRQLRTKADEWSQAARQRSADAR